LKKKRLFASSLHKSSQNLQIPSFVIALSEFSLLFLTKIVFKSGFSAFFQQRKSSIVQMNDKKDKYAGRCLIVHGKIESEDESGKQ